MKQRDPELNKGWVRIVHTLSVPTDGGPQSMLRANTEGSRPRQNHEIQTRNVFEMPSVGGE